MRTIQQERRYQSINIFRSRNWRSTLTLYLNKMTNGNRSDKIQMGVRGFIPVWLALILVFSNVSAQEQSRTFYRADENVSFKWRYGYSEYPFPDESASAREDALRGKFGWYDGSL